MALGLTLHADKVIFSKGKGNAANQILQEAKM